MTISLCMIVKDEEAVLARCLDSAKGLYDELVIADTGSSDGTFGIAKRYTEKVFSIPWRDDFSAARNQAFARATGDYLLWLDADDVLASPDIEALRALLGRERPDMLMCPYETGGLRFFRERFLRRQAGFIWQGRVHECIAPRGKVMRCGFTVRHMGSEKKRGSRNLDIYRKWAGEEKLHGRDLFYYGRELYYHKLYTEAAAVLREMLEGDGWYVNKIEACRVLASCLSALGDPEGALGALTRSFRYGEPRAAVLCDMGGLFLREKRWREAAFWYRGALCCRDHSEEGDFEEAGKRDLEPMLQLVVCYDALGERGQALFYHKKTEALAPEHPSVIYNRNYFSRAK